MSGYMLSCTSTMCNPKIYIQNFNIITFSLLDYVLLGKKNNSILLLLLKNFKVFHFIGYRCLNTSRKLCPKKTVAEIGCSSFDQLDLQSLNDYKFFVLVLQLQGLKKF